MRLLPKTAREQVSTLASFEGGQPLADRAPGLLGDLKPVFYSFGGTLNRKRLI
jgi:hypothetical protein